MKLTFGVLCLMTVDLLVKDFTIVELSEAPRWTWDFLMRVELEFHTIIVVYLHRSEHNN